MKVVWSIFILLQLLFFCFNQIFGHIFTLLCNSTMLHHPDILLYLKLLRKISNHKGTFSMDFFKTVTTLLSLSSRTCLVLVFLLLIGSNPGGAFNCSLSSVFWNFYGCMWTARNRGAHLGFLVLKSFCNVRSGFFLSLTKQFY